MGLGAAGLPVGCSNVGDMPPAVNRPDGTEADYASGRLVEPGISMRALERIGRQLRRETRQRHLGRIQGQIERDTAEADGALSDQRQNAGCSGVAVHRDQFEWLC